MEVLMDILAVAHDFRPSFDSSSHQIPSSVAVSMIAFLDLPNKEGNWHGMHIRVLAQGTMQRSLQF